MTNAPDTRKTHIIRIFGTNRNEDILPDIYADVERMDVIKSGMGDSDIPGAQWQGHQQKLRWCDDPSGEDYEPDGNPSREEELVKVCDPNSKNLNDPDEWIPIRRIKKMKSVSSHENFEGQQEQVQNVDDNESREFEARRIVYRDASIDDDAETAADNGAKVYVVPGDEYERNEESRDEDQYIEHEVVTYIKQTGNIVGQFKPGEQGRQIKFLNEYLIDESDPAKLEIVGENGIDPPYRLDPYQNIVNISFGTLAVEYNPVRERSWVVERENADMRKAVVSLWFRIPAATKAKAAASYDPEANQDETVMNGVIPLLVFGPQYTNTIYEDTFKTLEFKSAPGPTVEGSVTELNWGIGYVSGSHPASSRPSYIGINCTANEFALEVNVQTSDKPTCLSTSLETTGADVTFDYSVGDLVGTFPSYTLMQAASDSSYTDEGIRESFGNAGTRNVQITDTALGLPDVDQWHHVLLSWDVTKGCSTVGSGTDDPDDAHAPNYVTVASAMWCSIDDKNMNGYKLPAMWTYATYGAGNPNSIMSNICQKFAAQPKTKTAQTIRTGPPDIQENVDYDFGNPRATVVPTFLPLAPCYVPAPLSLAAQTAVLDYDVEMAEVQIWSGVTLNTADINSRRLFITADGKPELNYAAVDAILGTPVIRLHGTSGLKRGHNTGSLPNLEPSGKILKYRPNPSLHGKQFPDK